MKMNKPLKMILGLATGAYALFQVFFIPIWLLSVFTAMLSINTRGDPPPIFFFTFFGMFPLICLFNVLHFVLLPVYIIHIIKNAAGNEVYRILIGIGLFFLPWLALPVYFLISIWPENPPSWALADPGAFKTRAPGGADAPQPETLYYGAGEESHSNSALSASPPVEDIESPSFEATINEAQVEAQTEANLTQFASPAEFEQAEEPEASGGAEKKTRGKRKPKSPAEAAPKATNDETMIGAGPSSGEPSDEN
jgi:hypothetical protein